MVNLVDHPDFLKTLAESTPDMVYRYRLVPEPAFEYINAACFPLTGYSQDEFYADPYLSQKIIHPDDKAVLEAAAGNLSLVQQKVVMRWIRKDGEQIWVERYNTPIKGENGSIEAFEGIVHDITELVALQGKLNTAFEQKEVLFRELQHRIKNSFMMISGLFSMEIDKAESDETRIALSQMRARVVSISSLYSMLRVADTTHVKADEFIRLLVDSLLLDGHVSAKHELEPVEISARMISPIGIIINEMVTNSLKHAFKDGRMGEIGVSLRRTPENRLHLKISDNGPGFPPGFTPAQSKGLGTQLIEMLSEQLGGTPRWSSDDGLSLEMIVPIQ